jgi:hypothetical protein
MISTALPNPPRWLPVRIVLGGMLAACVIALSGGAGCFAAWSGLFDPALLARGGRSAIVFAIALLTSTSAGYTLSWLAESGGHVVTSIVAMLGRAVALFPVTALAWSLVGWWIGALGKPVETLMPFQLGAELNDWRLMFGVELWEYLAPALVLAVPLFGEVLGGVGKPMRARLQSLCLHGIAWLILIEDVLHFMGWGGWMAQAIRAGEAANVAAGVAVMAWLSAVFCTLLNALPTTQSTGAGPFATISWLPWPLWVLALSVSIASQQFLWLIMWLVIGVMSFPACFAKLRGQPATQQTFHLASWSFETLSQLVVWLAAIATLHPQPLTGGVMRTFQPLLITTPAQAAQTLADPTRILNAGLVLLGASFVLHLLSMAWQFIAARNATPAQP